MRESERQQGKQGVGRWGLPGFAFRSLLAFWEVLFLVQRQPHAR